MSKSSRRYLRTTVLGILAMAALIWVAMDQFELAPDAVAGLFLTTVLVLVLVIGAAAVVTLLWVGLRKLLRGKDPR